MYHCKLVNILILIFFFSTSCNNDMESDNVLEENATKKYSYTVDSSLGSSKFISLTNQSGEIIISHSPGFEGKNRTYEVNIDANDTIDITTGFATDNGFGILTYRNAPSGFLIESEYVNCDIDSTFDMQNPKDIKLDILGLVNYKQLIFPVPSKKIEEIDSQERVCITGVLSERKDIILTIQLEDDSYISTLLAFDMWESISENEFYRSVKIDGDFTNSLNHNISLGVDNTWIVEAEIFSDGRAITLAKGTSPVDYREGDELLFYTTQGIQIDSFRLEIRGAYITRGHKYFETLSFIPDSIRFYDPSIDFQEYNENSYLIEINDNYDFSEVSYSYTKGNYGSTWKIYSYGQGDADGSLPDLPRDFVSAATIYNELINSPDWITIRLLGNSFKGEDFYNRSSFYRRLKCNDYMVKYLSKRNP